MSSPAGRRSRYPLHLLLALVVVGLASFEVVQAANESDAEAAQKTAESAKVAALKQGTDGGSGIMGFVWAGFCILVGVPLLGGGLRLMHLTCAAGLGLAACFLVWMSFINSAPTNGFGKTPMLNDIVMSIPILGITALAFAGGFFRPARWVGHLLLCSSGVIALVLQAMLFKQGLLVPIVQVVWGLVGLATVLGVLAGLWWQRLAVAGCSSLTGCFLVGLAVDLILNGQKGMSFGLRVIFDNNDAHSTLLVRKDYKPTLKTVIILASSLGLALFMTVFQILVFKGDFIRRPLSKAWSSLLEPPSENEKGVDRSTKMFAEDVDPALITPAGEVWRRPWEPHTASPAVQRGIASSDGYFPPGAGGAPMNDAEQQRRYEADEQAMYEEQQRVMWEEQQRNARERQAWEASQLAGRVGMVVAPRAADPRGRQPGQTGAAPLSSDFFDPRTTLMRPPTAFRSPRQETAPFSNLYNAAPTPAPGPPTSSAAQQSSVPWAPLLRKMSRNKSSASQLAASKSQRARTRVQDLQNGHGPDRSMADSPSSVYSQQTSVAVPTAGRAALLRAVQQEVERYNYGGGGGGGGPGGMGKDRPLGSGEQMSGGRKYSPPSRMF